MNTGWNLPNKLTHAFLALAIFSLLNACTGGGGTETSENVGLPPSISEDQQSQITIVRLTGTQAEDLHVQTYRVRNERITYPMTVPGTVIAAPEHIAVISTPLNGRITKIFAHEGESVNRGDPLLEMESLEFAELAASYLESQAERNYLEQQVERLRSLVEQRISPQSTLDRANADLSRANTRVRAAIARLRAVGISDQQLEEWGEVEEDESAVLTMYATIDGKINQHLIDLGQAVNANDMLLDIVDNSHVLARGYVAPKDISNLEIGARAVISQRDDQGLVSVESQITTIQPGLDPENKSIIVNSLVETQNGWPVIGQSVRIIYDATTPSEVISIPLDAVQYEGQTARVFVKRDDLTFESRPINILRTLSESVIVSSGLSAGEEVAVTQVFSLKALGKFEEFAEE
jgi:cobalt-zinc-cadmium efflux system membrane fusion protein